MRDVEYPPSYLRACRVKAAGAAAIAGHTIGKARGVALQHDASWCVVFGAIGVVGTPIAITCHPTARSLGMS